MGCLKLTYQPEYSPLFIEKSVNRAKNVAQGFISTDPLKDDYPYYSSYQYAGNKPINNIDLDGLEPNPETDTGGQGGKLIDSKFKVAADQKVGDAEDFQSGLSGFIHNALILLPNLASESANGAIDAINYVAEEFENPGSKDPLLEISQAIENFADSVVDDAKRFHSQSLSEQGQELLNAAIDPTTYKLLAEIAITKKLSISKSVPRVKSTPLPSKVLSRVEALDDGINIKNADLEIRASNNIQGITVPELPDYGNKIRLGPNDTPQRIQGPWTTGDLGRAVNGQGPIDLAPRLNSANKPMSLEMHHADNMPGSNIHETLPGHKNDIWHQGINQGVTPEMRKAESRLHWQLRGQEMGNPAPRRR